LAGVYEAPTKKQAEELAAKPAETISDLNDTKGPKF
jgi:hypothetical protein